MRHRIAHRAEAIGDRRESMATGSSFPAIPHMASGSRFRKRRARSPLAGSARPVELGEIEMLETRRPSGRTRTGVPPPSRAARPRCEREAAGRSMRSSTAAASSAGRSASTSSPVAARFDQLGNAADASRHDRQARGHGLEHAVRARFRSRRQHEHVARREQRRDVGPLAEKPNLASPAPSSLTLTLQRRRAADRRRRRETRCRDAR